ncbi:uncharacterized protein MONBRDRAFT_28906 [Monosiga brevicollis MX1]|uniref:Cysteine synthase 1 n=1 Tax=Monosiga brevicollis TaxID=81824 RepID=A9V9E5_MONBE|nr:uncharacterized protein MONBRDRAFT_28906 [Monosiga brevicollis MX1]EDQ85916.1 predicted protein [Monosiga brevicollis MX1]|eukprot:XP_001749395.1 hypothetical protein [Monosiga brevicollis MX1]
MAVRWNGLMNLGSFASNPDLNWPFHMTPLVRLQGPSEETGCNIVAKIESMQPGGSVKDRAALMLVHDAEERGLIGPGGTVVEGTAGNTGIGLAHVCQARGYKCVIYMPNTQSKEKIDTLKALGADVRPVPAVAFSDPDNYNHQARRFAESVENAVWTNQFDNTANRRAHEVTTGPEIWAQTGGKVDAFTCATGTGGTLAGTALYLKQQNENIKIVLADPPGSVLYNYFTNGVLEREGTGSVTEADKKHARDGLHQTFKLLHEEGFCVGLSSGLNVQAAVEVAKQLGPGHTVATLICDSGLRYASRIFNREWLEAKDQKSDLNFFCEKRKNINNKFTQTPLIMAEEPNHRRRQLLGFGEAMVRFAPLSAAEAGVGASAALPADPTATVMLRSIGGDELNVTVAAAHLAADGDPAPQWISVLPEGPMGDVINASGAQAGVDTSLVVRVPNADAGIFTVIPEIKQKLHKIASGPCSNLPVAVALRWILTRGPNAKWLHMTGITPMISTQARLAWTQAMLAAYTHEVPVSMDFNHRPQLGSLEELWTVMAPHASRLQMLILSVRNLVDLANLEGLGAHVPSSETPLESPAWRRLQAVLRAHWRLHRLMVCYKDRDDQGLQRRWSAIADARGVHTTLKQPVFHRPKDECGGASPAFSCFMPAVFLCSLDEFELRVHESSSEVMDQDIFASRMVEVARRGDLMAALCQETMGDHSQVTRAQLQDVEASYASRAVHLDKLNSGTGNVDATLAHLKNAGVLAILRAKNPDAAIARGIELVELGCRALEVTLDTTEWRRVLQTLVEKLPANVCVGVGTVMDADVPLLPEIARLGAKFALSPIDPLGFIDACHRVGILAVPAGMTSNELWDMHRRGAKLIKLFHASMVTPKILKSMLGVSPLKAMNIAPSGGCSPDNVEEWWDAGAVCVGMGSNLAGKDINFATGTDGFEAGQKAWREHGRQAAQSMFSRVQARFPLASS